MTKVIAAVVSLCFSVSVLVGQTYADVHVLPALDDSWFGIMGTGVKK